MNNQDIIFDEESHVYTRNNTQYTSVTTLLKNYNLSADYTGIPQAVLQKAAQRGTNVHKMLEEYIKNKTYVPDGILDAFIQYVNNRGIDLSTAYSERVIYDDTFLLAGTLDFEYDDGNEHIIADFKTTSSIHWDAVSWQLSIYNYMVCKGDVLSYLTNRLKVYHIPQGKFSVHEVPLIPYEEVSKLLNAQLVSAPYVYTPDPSIVIQPSECVILEQLVLEISQYETILKELKHKRDLMLNSVKEKMKDNFLMSLNVNNTFTFKYKLASTRKSFDQDKAIKFLEAHGEDVNNYYKVTNISDSVEAKPIKQKVWKGLEPTLEPIREGDYDN